MALTETEKPRKEQKWQFPEIDIAHKTGGLNLSDRYEIVVPAGRQVVLSMPQEIKCKIFMEIWEFGNGHGYHYAIKYR